MTYLDHPLRVDARGATAAVDDRGWLRDLVEQVLFTAPGERVHRPDFGSGLLQLVFAGQTAELGATVQFLVQGALHQWLGHLIEVESVAAEASDGVLVVMVSYVVRRTGERREDRFEQEAPL